MWALQGWKEGSRKNIINTIPIRSWSAPCGTMLSRLPAEGSTSFSQNLGRVNYPESKLGWLPRNRDEIKSPQWIKEETKACKSQEDKYANLPENCDKGPVALRSSCPFRAPGQSMRAAESCRWVDESWSSPPACWGRCEAPKASVAINLSSLPHSLKRPFIICWKSD